MANDPLPIKGVLAELGARSRLGHPLETGFVWARWRQIVGDAIADHARPSSLRDGVLRVRADSPVWATEIGYLSQEIRGRVNGALGDELVREVKVWTGPNGPSPERRGASSGDAAAPTAGARTRAAPDDPESALRRARAAWARRASRGALEARETP